MSRKNPIGIFDSGVGGLTVVKEVMRQLPNEKIIYLGDNARCPYGPRPMEEVRKFSWEIANFLMEKNIKMLIIACNTATAAALDDLRGKLDIPVIGVIYPGARTAIKQTRNKRIAVIGTIGTIESGAYEQALESIDSGVNIFGLACPKFAPIVESNEWNHAVARKVIKESLQPLQTFRMDTLVLGCTHYPLIKEIIAEEVGSDVKIICSGNETAAEASAILYHTGLLNHSNGKGQPKFYTTGSIDIFKKIALNWLGKSFDSIEKVSLKKIKF